MNVVFISTLAGHPWGGSEELWSQATLRLRSAGHRISASVGPWPGTRPRIAELEQAGIRVDQRKGCPQSFFLRALRKLTRGPVGETNEDAAWNWVLQQQPDLICVAQSGSMDGLQWMSRARASGIPYVIISQANAEGFWPSDDWSAELARGYHSAVRSYFVSDRNRLLLEDQIGEILPNAETVFNPFNVEYDTATEWCGGDEESEVRLACVARLEPAAKGQDILFQVLSAEKWRRRKLRVTLFGKGPCERNLRSLVSKYELSSVDFGGYSDDIKTIWSRNHALILPSRFEGTPLALVEAMLCSRMAIVTDVAGNGELVEDGRSGFLAAAPTAALLDAAMERAWAARNSWQELGQEARRRVTSLVPRDPIGRFCEQLEWTAKVSAVSN